MVEVSFRGKQPVENYGVIGDLYTVALVSMDGPSDFFLSILDSPRIFATLLGHAAGWWFQSTPQLGLAVASCR